MELTKLRTLTLVGALACGLSMAAGACGGSAEDNTTTGPGGASSAASGSTSSSAAKSSSSGETTSTAAGLTTSSGSNTTSTSTSSSMGCTADKDCSGKTPKCDTTTHECVGCIPGKAGCASGEYCDPNTETCTMGCETNTDCPSGMVCDPITHNCGQCVTDTDCPSGNICAGDMCIPGCDMNTPCLGGLACCGDLCIDTSSDPNACGMCGKQCTAVANADPTCSGGMCSFTCKSAFADCNADPSDGCEWNVLLDGPCTCTPGSMQSCYDGAPGTEGVGPCKAGTQTCNPDGTSWGPCVGEVLPQPEICSNGVDEDCDGAVDDVPDIDGDGWTACDGDCCETTQQCSNPALVNPGAFEVVGNGVDDDCDGTVDNAIGSCDGALASNSTDPLDYARAIDLCSFTTANPPLAQKKWGVISGMFSLADGTGTPFASARSIRTGFGSGVTPLAGKQIAVLSSGVAAAQTAPNNKNPAFSAFQGGHDNGKSSGMPADWLAANGNVVPNSPGCPAPQGGNTAHDPIQLELSVRVPTNAQSFSVSTFFYSSEYPEWVCSPYNDFFLTLLDSKFTPGPGQTANPADKNLAFYDPPPAGPPYYPVGVNLAFGNTGLFSQCLNGPTGCASGSVAGNTNTCVGTSQLTGTGFDIANPPPEFPGDPGYCGASNLAGGGTGWLTTGGNVVPGETIQVRFDIWDTGDQWYDSLVLLDNFQWSLTATTPGTHQ